MLKQDILVDQGNEDLSEVLELKKIPNIKLRFKNKDSADSRSGEARAIMVMLRNLMR
jgi:hypothetical protein